MKKRDIKRIWMISDIHFGVRTDSYEWVKNLEDYFENFFIPLIKDNKQDGDILMVMGDIFENQKSIDILVGNTAHKVMRDIAEVIDVIIICGNHDKYKKNDNGVNSIASMSMIPNIEVYIDNHHIQTAKNENLLLCPFSKEVSHIEDYIKTMSKGMNIDYVFSHIDIAGLKFQNGVSIKTGLSMENDNFKKFYSGHIHAINGNDKFQYVGSPYHTSRGDIGQEKGIFLLDVTSGKETFFLNDYSPKFVRIELTPELRSMPLSHIRDLVNNNYVDIFVPLDIIDTFDQVQFQSLLSSLGAKYRHLEFKRAKQNNVAMVNVSTSGEITEEGGKYVNKTLCDVINDIILANGLPEDKSLTERIILENSRIYNLVTTIEE